MLGVGLCNVAQENWWSASTTLYVLVLDCGIAKVYKGDLDTEVGLKLLCKRLFPSLVIPETQTPVSQHLLELCTGGGDIPDT